MSSLTFQALLSRTAPLIAIAVLLGGCVNATVDEMTYNEPVAGIGESSVVILGRRHAQTTTPSLILSSVLVITFTVATPASRSSTRLPLSISSIPGSSHAPRLCNHKLLIDCYSCRRWPSASPK